MTMYLSLEPSLVQFFASSAFTPPSILSSSAHTYFCLSCSFNFTHLSLTRKLWLITSQLVQLSRVDTIIFLSPKQLVTSDFTFYSYLVSIFSSKYLHSFVWITFDLQVGCWTVCMWLSLSASSERDSLFMQLVIARIHAIVIWPLLCDSSNYCFHYSGKCFTMGKKNISPLRSQQVSVDILAFARERKRQPGHSYDCWRSLKSISPRFTDFIRLRCTRFGDPRSTRWIATAQQLATIHSAMRLCFHLTLFKGHPICTATIHCYRAVDCWTKGALFIQMCPSSSLHRTTVTQEMETRLTDQRWHQVKNAPSKETLFKEKASQVWPNKIAPINWWVRWI